jgi:hypothetical protein
MGDQDLESERWLRCRSPASDASGVAKGSYGVAPGDGISDGFNNVILPRTSRLLHDPEIGPDGSWTWPGVVPLGERVLFDGCTEPVPIFGRQDPTFSEYLIERPGGVDAPHVEGAQKGWSIDEPLPEREEAQEQAPSHVVLGHEQIPSSWPSPR